MEWHKITSKASETFLIKKNTYREMKSKRQDTKKVEINRNIIRSCNLTLNGLLHAGLSGGVGFYNNRSFVYAYYLRAFSIRK